MFTQCPYLIRIPRPNDLNLYTTPVDLACFVEPTSSCSLETAGVHWAGSKWFRVSVRVVIFVNFITVVVFSGLAFDNRSVTRVLDLVFLLVYTVEAVAKLIYYGRGYFRVRWNLFDFSLVLFGWLSLILDETIGGAGIVIMVGPGGIRCRCDQGQSRHGHVPLTQVHSSTQIRSVRLLRILRLRDSFRHVLATMRKALCPDPPPPLPVCFAASLSHRLPAAVFVLRNLGKYILVLFCVQYMFAIVGMQAFHNSVSSCSGVDGGRCGKDGFVDQGYYQLNNFDNILYSFNTLFDLLVVNNWWVPPLATSGTHCCPQLDI